MPTTIGPARGRQGAGTADEHERNEQPTSHGKGPMPECGAGRNEAIRVGVRAAICGAHA
jgi:hypothetical protein